MRSKEVDKSIKSLENFVNQKYYNGVTADEMKTVLAYIEELEKRDKAVLVYFDKEGNPIEYINKQVIRDKIKELEDRKQKIRFETESEIKRYVEEDLEQDLIFKHRCLEAGYEINKIERDIEVLKSIIGG